MRVKRWWRGGCNAVGRVEAPLFPVLLCAALMAHACVNPKWCQVEDGAASAGAGKGRNSRIGRRAVTQNCCLVLTFQIGLLSGWIGKRAGAFPDVCQEEEEEK